MKTILALACLSAATLLPHRAAAQGTVHTVFGDHPANTANDLKGAITRFPYAWEIPDGKSSVAFKSDGTGKQTFFSFTWTVKNAQEIELTLAGSGMKAALKFSDDYTTYTGTDFDGRAVHGSVVMPQAAAVAPPPVAAATPAAANTNPFMSEHLGDAGGGDSTAALEKAIINSTFTWEPEGDSDKTLTFLPNGVGKNTFFPITWRIKGPHAVEIGIPTDKEKGKIILRFSNDFSKYTATDFDGVSALKGHKIEK